MYYDILAVQDKEFLKKLRFKPVDLNIAVIKPKNTNDLKLLANKNKNADLIVLHKPTDKLLKAAISRCSVDAIDAFVKYPLIKKMAEKNIAVIINFNDLLETRNIEKTLHLMTRTVRLALKYKVPIMITSGAKTEWELRSASDLIGLGEVLKMTAGQAKKALYQHQEKILERKKLRKAGKWVAPGIKVV